MVLPHMVVEQMNETEEDIKDLGSAYTHCEVESFWAQISWGHQAELLALAVMEDSCQALPPRISRLSE